MFAFVFVFVFEFVFVCVFLIVIPDKEEDVMTRYHWKHSCDKHDNSRNCWSAELLQFKNGAVCCSNDTLSVGSMGTVGNSGLFKAFFTPCTGSKNSHNYNTVMTRGW